MSPSQPSSCSGLRQFTVGNAPITPLRQAATTRSTPETRNIGAAISGRLRRSRKRASESAAFWSDEVCSSAPLFRCASVRRHWHDRRPKRKQATKQAPKQATKSVGGTMSDPLYAFPTACCQTLRALARYPSRVAFSWPGGSITYAGATELIGRFQKVFMQLGLEPCSRVAFLTANRADTWCAGVAAQLSRLAITWLHPLGSLDDQLFQLEDSDSQMLVVDAAAFRDRGGDLAAKSTSNKSSSDKYCDRSSSNKASGVKTVFTLGPADYGVDLLAAIEEAGHATARCLAGTDDIATLNYTGGTTGKSKG